MKSFSCFVTGTDTGIGKTLVTCTIIKYLSKQGIVAGMKPVAAGAMHQNHKWSNDDMDAIMNASNIALSADLVTPYLLKTAASPNIAANLENKVIDLSQIRKSYEELQKSANSVIVEGVGGFLVPLSDHDTVADLAVQFALPIVLVVGLRLGCINHTLLTVEAILSRKLHLAGWVANHIDSEMTHQTENIALLEKLIPAPRLATIPHIKNISASEASKYFDFSKLHSQ